MFAIVLAGGSKVTVTVKGAEVINISLSVTARIALPVHQSTGDDSISVPEPLAVGVQSASSTSRFPSSLVHSKPNPFSVPWCHFQVHSLVLGC